ncbi:MAG: RluA family pseudouridine synthase [Clostridia bacterium]|nr:RluA family pseudouridine synthase [Clostridia bacterium]
MRTLELIVASEDAGRTLGALLRSRLHLSAHRIASLKFSNGITLDGAVSHTDTRVQAGQVIRVLLRDAPAALVPYDIPISIPYRDEDLLIVDKPAPLAAIHGAQPDGHSLENAVFAALGCPEIYVYRPVSRLDKGTSGLMPVALNAHVHDRMQRLLHTADYIREYLAVTEGAPKDDEGVCCLAIGHADGVKRCIAPDGKPAVTHYRVLQRTVNGRALIRLRLETGRTHQIRVHMQALGCPVAGDWLYGTSLPELPGRFALHSAYLAFTHPLTGEKLIFESPLPEGLSALLRK